MKIESNNKNTFLVTGGASGLGEATVRRLVQEGANVVILDMNEEQAKQLVNELDSNRVVATQCNVLDEKDVKKAIELGVEKFGAIHGAINCAGIAAAHRVLSKRGPFPLKMFETVMNVNVAGTFNVCRLVADQISKQKVLNSDNERGVLINVASVAAFDGQVGQAAYSASKGGVVSLALPMARDLASVGIRVNTIAPGLFSTPMLEMLPEEAKKSLIKQIPFPARFGKSEEFADLVVFLIKNSYINGECIRLDGSIRMSSM
jgi:3-hydroxyacyl-CoA dehydrogenase/3-hydroxy-2-methylbutyryl-CoA dehydrogenase